MIKWDRNDTKTDRIPKNHAQHKKTYQIEDKEDVLSINSISVPNQFS